MDLFAYMHVPQLLSYSNIYFCIVMLISRFIPKTLGHDYVSLNVLK